MTFEPGTVWLVGAGPGDPGLLTLHAARALAEADVVLHDALVSPEILALAPQARLEPVGKRAGGRRTPQLRINQRLIGLAREGHRVVRLKGGDPLVFGRGGEEALALAAAGIRFRIVPGVSAGIGGAAAAGIPVTHRGLAHSVAFVTGHDATGESARTRLERAGARRRCAGALHGAAPDRRDRGCICARPGVARRSRSRSSPRRPRRASAWRSRRWRRRNARRRHPIACANADHHRSGRRAAAAARRLAGRRSAG